MRLIVLVVLLKEHRLLRVDERPGRVEVQRRLCPWLDRRAGGGIFRSSNGAINEAPFRVRAVGDVAAVVVSGQ